MSKRQESQGKASAQISDALDKALEDVPAEKKAQTLQEALLGVTIQQSSSFTGPLPPPALLKEYSDIVENGAERIFRMTEMQSAHRMQLEDYAIKEELSQSRRGQNFGFALGVLGLILATVLALSGYEWVAGVFGTTTIVGLVTVFVIGKKAQRNQE